MINFDSKVFIFFSFFIFVVFAIGSSFLYFLLSPNGYFTDKTNEKHNVNKSYSVAKNNVNKGTDLLVTKNPKLKNSITSPILDGNDPVIGNKNGHVTIVEFFDYDCEFCKKQHQIIVSLIQGKYNGKIKLIMKNFPKNDTTSLSWKSAVASRCAYVQNRFIPYNNYLLNSDKKLSDKLFLELAEKSNLNIKEFKKCYKTQEVNHFIKSNIKEANSLKIYGVPFYYIGSQEIMGSLDTKTLEKIIKIELAKSNGSK